jgi:hypothetical protein
MKRRWKVIVPVLMLSTTVIAVVPEAQAQTCRVYSLTPQLAQSNPGTFTQNVRSGDVSCQQARQVMDDFDAGKGTPFARNGSMVDGWRPHSSNTRPGGFWAQTMNGVNTPYSDAHGYGGFEAMTVAF